MSNDDLEPLWTQTKLGLLYLYWNHLSVEEFLRPIHKLVEEIVRNHDPGFEDMTFGDENPVPDELWPDMQEILLANLRDAIVQAQRECIAVARAKTYTEPKNRNDLVTEASMQAQLASVARLRSTFSFPHSDTERVVTPMQRLEAQLSLCFEVMTAVYNILIEGNEKPTLSKVARRLNLGQQNTLNGNDTGKIILSKKLKEQDIKFKAVVSAVREQVSREKLTRLKNDVVDFCGG